MPHDPILNEEMPLAGETVVPWSGQRQWPAEGEKCPWCGNTEVFELERFASHGVVYRCAKCNDGPESLVGIWGEKIATASK